MQFIYIYIYTYFINFGLNPAAVLFMEIVVHTRRVLQVSSVHHVCTSRHLL